jgi:hypothetical protein
MSRCNPLIPAFAALAIAVLAASPASARPLDAHPRAAGDTATQAPAPTSEPPAADGRSGDVAAALAQERYYSSYGQPATLSARAVRSDDGTPAATIALGLAGALVVLGAATAGGRHRIRVRGTAV